ncbi:hypothetical protein [Alteribacter populi]|uniref:hypothetical protein n=1 Tax=Alteribacter populi TaxID=2011011 RepID=UPI000BBB5D96|nr:hypothetical protein [Alteribacter populi]
MQYDGKVYEKAGNPKKGDIAVFNENNSFFQGQWSEVLAIDAAGDPVLCAAHHLHWYARHLDYYRQVTEKLAPKPGRYIIFTDKDDKPMDTRVGKRYKIIWDGKYCDDVGDYLDAEHVAKFFPYEIVEHEEPKQTSESTETIEHDGTEYRRVHRKAKPGDVVVFTETADADITEGIPYEVEDVDSDGDVHFLDDKDEGNVGISREEFDIYGKVAEESAEQDEVKSITVRHKDGTITRLQDVESIELAQ